jgi:hypothetical protein
MDYAPGVSPRGGPQSGFIAVVAALAICSLLAAACGSAPRSTALRRPRSTASPAVATSALPANSGYQAARQQWIAEGLVFGSAAQNPPLYLAVVDLEHGQVANAGSKPRYRAAIAAINNLEQTPLSNITRAERRGAAADFSRIDRFFHLPAVNNCGVASGTAARAAAAAWNTEPHNSTSGIAAAPLRRALADLAQQLSVHPAGTSCYPAAIADLRNLESATKADIRASAVEFTGRGATVFGAEIAYLGVFFDALDGFNGSDQNVLVPISAQCC